MREQGAPFEGDIWRKKGCRNGTADFDKLFFISKKHVLHLCTSLMKEERPLLLAKTQCVYFAPCTCVQAFKQACVPGLCNPRDSVFVLLVSYKWGEVIDSAWATQNLKYERRAKNNNKEDSLLIIPLFLTNPIIHTSGIKVVGRIFQKPLLQHSTEAQSVSEYVLYIVILQWLQKQLLWSWNVKESQQGNHCLLKAVSA